MKIHGIARLMGDIWLGERRRISTVRLSSRKPPKLPCSVAPCPGLVHCNPLKKPSLPARECVRNLSMSNEKKQYRIAVIPGDGIGKEVVPEGLRVLETAAKKHGVSMHFDHFDFASWDYYEKHGQMMPDD